VPLAARFVVVVTSTQSRFGLTARKTLIMPSTVRYDRLTLTRSCRAKSRHHFERGV